MATGDLALGQLEGTTSARERVINDFSINVATVNGSGSQSANSVLLKSIFGMGVPVSGKNLFPSNIAGLPTWYTIRASKDGYVARKRDSEVLVALNPDTAREDTLALPPGAVAIYEEKLDLKQYRDDVTFYPVPLDKITAAICAEPKLRKLVRNMVYVGAVAQLLRIDLGVVEKGLQKQFAKKVKVFELNFGAVKAGFDYAQQNLPKQDPYFIERSNQTAGKIIIDGNAAAGMGAVFAGVTVVAWYPITPSTSLIEATTDLLKKFRVSPEGKATYAVVQAEDELAAIGMVIGAAWNGARAFTSTAGPGISLMNELLGFAYYTEIPAVIIDVERVGPSTGMPTRTQQGDLLECAYASHGDTKHILLFPSNPAECFDFAPVAFDLAERFQTPVFLMSDLDIGMNDWVVPRLQWDDNYQPDRGRVLSLEEIEKLTKFQRYANEDANQVVARTFPGVHPKASYFTRGSGHNKYGGYTEIPDEYQEVMDRLLKKHRAAAKFVPAPIIQRRPGSSFGIVTLGGCDPAVREALDLLAERGVVGDFMRVRGFPFDAAVESFINEHDISFVIEQNRDAQLRSLLTLETNVPKDKLRSVLVYGGFPLSARHVIDGVLNVLAPESELATAGQKAAK
jgi:2-oxoglutarate ferredoxin oxidoreductase subunit alpha